MLISKKRQGLLTGLLLSAGTLMLPGNSNTMEIVKYDQMSVRDKARYGTMLWEQSALSFLNRNRVTDKDIETAKEIRRLFTEVIYNEVPEGTKQFLRIVDQLREINPSIDVESAITLNLQKNAIDFPLDQMMQFAIDFKPSEKTFGEKGPAPSSPAPVTTTPDSFRFGK